MITAVILLNQMKTLGKLTLRNCLAILTGLAIAFWIVFARFSHEIVVPFPASDDGHSLIVQTNLDVFIKTRKLEGYDQPLHNKSNITVLSILSRNVPVKRWEKDDSRSQFKITYDVTLLQKMRLLLGDEYSVLMSE